MNRNTIHIDEVQLLFEDPQHLHLIGQLNRAETSSQVTLEIHTAMT